jgi:hypothetical protein
LGLAKEALENIIFRISSDNACGVDGPGKAIFRFGRPVRVHRDGKQGHKTS